MSFFLFKPHVEGPTGDITTPDIIIDHLLLSADGALNPIPTSGLSSAAEIGIEDSAAEALPGYILTAAGGGVIMSPALVIRTQNAALDITHIRIGRLAWRFKNVSDHIDEISLSAPGLETTICNLGDPRDIIDEVPGARDGRLPRGTAILCLSKNCSVGVQTSVRFTVTLKDSALDHNLALPFDLYSAVINPWPERPLARYSVGPQEGDVKHYI